MTNNDALEQAISAALRDPAQASGVDVALLAAELYVVPTEGAPPAGVVLGRDRPLLLQGLVLKAGQQATAAFTRPEGATPVFGAPASMGMRGLHLLEAFRSGWIILNPGQTGGLVLSPDDIALILAQAGTAVPLSETADVALEAPERSPDLLITRLRSSLAHGGVTAAWLARSTDRKTGATGWRLEVRGGSAPQEIRRLVAAAVDGLDFGGEALDLVLAPPSGADGPGVRLI